MERMVDQSGKSGVTFNVISAHSNFSEDIQIERMVDRSGQPDERNSSNAQSRNLLEEQRQTIIAEYREESRSSRTSFSSRRRRAPTPTRTIMAPKIWNFVKLVNKVLQKWRNYGNSRVLLSIRSRRRKLIEDQNAILELSGRVQELQNEVNCMNDSKDFQDAESVRSGNSHVTSRPVSFPPHPIPEGMLRHSFVSPSRREGPPSISGNVFADPVASSTAPSPQELNPWSSGISEPIHSSTEEKNENRTPVQDQRCQSGPSAKDSVIFSGGDSSKKYGADQQRLQILHLHFDKFPTPATFACWKIRFKTEVCTCSQFPTEAMQWIKEVEMVWMILNLHYQYGYFNAEFWSTWCEDCFSVEQNHPWFSFQKKNQVWRNRRPRSRTVSFVADRLLTWSTILPWFLSKTMPTYSLSVYEMTIFRNSTWSGTEFYCLWRKSHLMTSWTDCTNSEHESVRNSRPYWNCITWRFIRRS